MAELIALSHFRVRIERGCAFARFVVSSFGCWCRVFEVLWQGFKLLPSHNLAFSVIVLARLTDGAVCVICACTHGTCVLFAICTRHFVEIYIR